MMRIVPPLLEHARKPHSDCGSGFLTATRSSDSTYSRYVSSSTPSSRLKNPLPRTQKRVFRHILIADCTRTHLKNPISVAMAKAIFEMGSTKERGSSSVPRKTYLLFE